MVAKKIDLGPGLIFASITEAKAHFDRILKGTPINQHVSDAEFKSLKTLYEAYCKKTNWPLPSPPKSFFTRYEQFTTKCFGVEFENGTSNSFSLDKALRAVAN